MTTVYRGADGRLRYPYVLVFPDGRTLDGELDRPVRRIKVPTLLERARVTHVDAMIVYPPPPLFGVVELERTRFADRDGRRIFL